MPTEDNFESELIRWKQHCNGITETKSITQIWSKDAVLLFFPNVRELLCILAVLPVGSAEVARSFSCLRQVHTWLRTTMTCDRLGNLGVLALHGFGIPLNIRRICSTFRSQHPRRMCSPSVLYMMIVIRCESKYYRKRKNRLVVFSLTFMVVTAVA